MTPGGVVGELLALGSVFEGEPTTKVSVLGNNT